MNADCWWNDALIRCRCACGLRGSALPLALEMVGSMPGGTVAREFAELKGQTGRITDDTRCVAVVESVQRHPKGDENQANSGLFLR